jgi:hypothetical protein
MIYLLSFAFWFRTNAISRSISTSCWPPTIFGRFTRHGRRGSFPRGFLDGRSDVGAAPTAGAPSRPFRREKYAHPAPVSFWCRLAGRNRRAFRSRGGRLARLMLLPGRPERVELLARRPRHRPRRSCVAPWGDGWPAVSAGAPRVPVRGVITNPLCLHAPSWGLRRARPSGAQGSGRWVLRGWAPGIGGAPGVPNIPDEQAKASGISAISPANYCWPYSAPSGFIPAWIARTMPVGYANRVCVASPTSDSSGPTRP